MKIGILTSGGDCPGLNAALRGFANYIYRHEPHAEIVGILEGYRGLMTGNTRIMAPADFAGIIRQGGTVLGTSRQPFRKMMEVDLMGLTKLELMEKQYRKLDLDMLLVLGGVGTHKTANLLVGDGLNVIGLPKTIDNDIWNTDMTFGFSTAVENASSCMDMLRTTADSHGRVMIVELMGNKTGWLTLFSGIAAAADIILIPEIPFSRQQVAHAVSRRMDEGRSCMIAVAEGALADDEVKLTRDERLMARNGMKTCTDLLSSYLESKVGVETRISVPGHIIRGGEANAFDRILSSEMGTYAGSLALDGRFGTTVAVKEGRITYNMISDIAGKMKCVPKDSSLLSIARDIGSYLGD